MNRFESTSAIITLAVFLIGLPVRATAGHPHARDGWTAGFSVGGGPGKFTAATGGDSSTESGGSINFRIGKALTPTFTLSFETDSWLRSESTDLGPEVTFSFWNFAAAGTLYPSETGGLYLRGGIGYANADIDLVEGNTTVGVSESGFGILAAAGYEWRLTTNFALGATGGYDFLFISGDIFDSAQFGFVAIDLNWYWGTTAP